MDQEKVYLEDIEAKLATAEELSKAGIEIPEDRQDDLLYIKFTLCHSGRNLNGDFFTKEDLKDSYRTIENKPLTRNHNPDETVGHVIASEHIEGGDGEEDYVNCIAVVYKYYFKKDAKKIAKAFEDNKFRVSMENLFARQICSHCSAEFKANSQTCEHIKGRTSKWAGASRIFKDFVFSAVSYLDGKAPGDPDAVGLAIASKPLEKFLESISNHYPAKEVAQFIKQLESGELAVAEKDSLNSSENSYMSIGEAYKLFENDNVDIKTRLESVKGEIMDVKTYTQEQLDSAIEKAVATAVADVKADEEKVKEIDKLKTDLASANKKAEDAQAEVTKAQNEKDAIQLQLDQANQAEANRVKAEADKKLSADRMKTLDGKGYAFKTNRDSVAVRVGQMSEEEFGEFEKMLAEIKSAPAPTGIATASVEEDGDPIEKAWATVRKAGK